jgi:hypothetical protein
LTNAYCSAATSTSTSTSTSTTTSTTPAPYYCQVSQGECSDGDNLYGYGFCTVYNAVDPVCGGPYATADECEAACDSQLYHATTSTTTTSGP